MSTTRAVPRSQAEVGSTATTAFLEQLESNVVTKLRTNKKVTVAPVCVDFAVLFSKMKFPIYDMAEFTSVWKSHHYDGLLDIGGSEQMGERKPLMARHMLDVATTYLMLAAGMTTTPPSTDDMMFDTVQGSSSAASALSTSATTSAPTARDIACFASLLIYHIYSSQFRASRVTRGSGGHLVESSLVHDPTLVGGAQSNSSRGATNLQPNTQSGIDHHTNGQEQSVASSSSQPSTTGDGLEAALERKRAQHRRPFVFGVDNPYAVQPIRLSPDLVRFVRSNSASEVEQLVWQQLAVMDRDYYRNLHGCATAATNAGVPSLLVTSPASQEGLVLCVPVFEIVPAVDDRFTCDVLAAHSVVRRSVEAGRVSSAKRSRSGAPPSQTSATRPSAISQQLEEAEQREDGNAPSMDEIRRLVAECFS